MRPKTKTSSILDRIKRVAARGLQVLLISVILGVVCRYCFTDSLDPYKCSALLNRGEWRDPGPRWSTRNPYQNWQPPGCLMHEYTRIDIQECFKHRRMVFIGDSTTRQIFWAIAKKMDSKRAEEQLAEMDVMGLDQKQKDLEFASGTVVVQFIWDPFLNSTGLEYELRKFRAKSSPVPDIDESAGLLLLGSPGLWFARHGHENYHRDFRSSIDAIIPYMDHTPHNHSILPRPNHFPSIPRQLAPNLLLLAPIQVPRYQSLSPSREETITPAKIDQMNDYIQQVSANSGADVMWSYSLMTESGRNTYEESGLHVTDNVAHRKADVLLNLRCNADAATRGYPFNRTCCSNYSQPGGAQWIIIVLGMLVFPILCFTRQKHWRQISQSMPCTEVMDALTIFGLVVCYCFYADRTQIFEKAQKQYQQKSFLIACAVALVVGLATIKKNKASATKMRDNLDHGFLSRDQTNEWKGWMQCFVLLYHFTSASKVFWIYETIRVLVASYLFMVGFGHAAYFLKRKDYSLNRVVRVLLRLNLLSCVLPYMMRTDYLFYYFAPLASFWFLVVYFTLKIGHTKNSNFGFLLFKFMLSAMITTFLIKIPGILEFGFTVLRYTCAISWSAQEWRFRIFLDMYIVYVGMTVAALYHRYSALNFSSVRTSDSYLNRLIRLTIAYPRIWKTSAVLLAKGLFPAFLAVAQTHTKKEDFNWWHTYLSFWPILCFVTLRNSNRIMRNYHSTLFAWLGRCSLETYVLQYHIWLAGDTQGLLRLGLFNRWVEAALISVLFLWISHRTAEATHRITEWIIGQENVSGSTSREVEDTAGEKNSPYLLPKTNGLEKKRASVFNFEREGDNGWVARGASKLSKNLKWRLGLVFLVMWVTNVTYR